MKYLNDWFESSGKFNYRFAIYLPSCEKDGKPIDGFENLADSTSHLLCDLFGGVTSYAATGLFQRQSGIPQREDILVMESFSDRETWERNSRFLRSWTRVLARLLRQESIACSLDGNMSFVQPAQLQGWNREIGDYEALQRNVLADLNRHECR